MVLKTKDSGQGAAVPCYLKSNVRALESTVIPSWVLVHDVKRNLPARYPAPWSVGIMTNRADTKQSICG
ncbi:hypothetical protein TNCT_120421 [Trichonephila clavata]|uniref:Uncharacterized protein n=1 Tax=Trichonephila clavata TaxID=2740835 RepID=A0A8X6JN90_TRICU|nr:hypothetical protein TNCT_120421 [Trichonephila clavata]